MFDDAEERQAAAPPAQAAGDTGSEGGGSSSDGEGSGSGSDDDDAPPADLVEHIFDSSGKRARPGSATGGKPGSQRGAGPAGGAGGMPRTPQHPLADSEAERLRLERKRFMSSKAAVITSGGPGSQPGSQRRRRPGGTPSSMLGGEGDGVSKEEFMAMQREVQQLGEAEGAVLLASCRCRHFGCLAWVPPAAALLGAALCMPCRLLVLHWAPPRRACGGAAASHGHPPAAPATRPWELFPRATRPPRRAAVPHKKPACGHIVQPSAAAGASGAQPRTCVAASNPRHTHSTCILHPICPALQAAWRHYPRLCAHCHLHCLHCDLLCKCLTPLLPHPRFCLPTGATALDKKSRKKFEMEQLARLGAKAESRPRMAASIGHGMAKKQAQRAERALQEGIAGGSGHAAAVR